MTGFSETITVNVPIAFTRRRGRKRVEARDGTGFAPKAEPEIDNALVKAIARAHRWQRMLESGDYATLRELAKAERINSSYVSRILRLTLLSPNHVETALDGARTSLLGTQALAKPFPVDWQQQAHFFELLIGPHETASPCSA